MSTIYFVDANATSTGTGVSHDPFPTIQQAAALIKPGDVCEIRAGTYRETVIPAHSGTDEAPLVFRADKNAKVIITGCDPVQHWEHERGQIYYARTQLHLDAENQVFADDTMMWEARWPNAGGTSPNHLLEFATATMDEGTTPTQVVDQSLPDREWAGATAWIASHKRWFCWTGRVTEYGKGYFTLENNADAAENHVCKESGQYYLFGTKAALDTENEWVYDKKAQRLYAWVPGGGDPKDRVAVKRRLWAFDLRGKAHITIENVTILGASIATDANSEHIALDGLQMRYIYHAATAEEQYRSQQESGLILRGNGHSVRNCEIAFSSGNGILLAGHDCHIINNYIHDCNYIGSYAAPLTFARGTSGHRVSHNTLTRAGRSCISTAGLYDSIVQYNDVSFAGYLTYDLGLTYGNGVEGGNAEVRYNWFHDNISQHICFGIYFDHGCKNIIIHHNVVWNVKDAGLVNNQYANYLLYYHNTVSGSEYAYKSTWAAAQAPDLYGCYLINNLGSAGIQVKGQGLKIMNNAWDYKTLTDDKLPLANTMAIDTAQYIEGLNSEHTGEAPDCGAYEWGRPAWKAGHNFDNPPETIDAQPIAAPHRNLLRNPALHHRQAQGWEIVGHNVRIITERHSQWVTDGRVVMHGHSFELGAGKNAVKQRVTGLTPNTTYALMGMFRVDRGEQARLGVLLDANQEAYGQPISDNAPSWERRTLRFTTGPEENEVLIFAEKLSPGDGLVYVDDMGLQWIE